MSFSLHPVRRTVSFAAVVATAFSMGTSAASAAADLSLREVTLAQRAGAGSLGGPNEFDAGFGYVTWVESRGQGASYRTRIVIRHEGRVRRAAWKRGSPRLELRRRIDQRTGRAVVRLITTTCAETGECRDTLLSPNTLKPKRTVWAPEPAADGATFGVDGATTVRSIKVLDPAPAKRPSEWFYVDEVMPPSHCDFSLVAGTGALPSLPDCARADLRVRGSVVVADAGVPSKTAPDGYFSAGVLQALDLKRPEAGWQRVATKEGGKGGTNGFQHSCLLDDGVAVLSGDNAGAAKGWTLSFVPVGGTRAAWTAPVPQLTPARHNRGGGLIACSGTSIYANYAASVGTAKHKRKVNRLVRLEPTA